MKKLTLMFLILELGLSLLTSACQPLFNLNPYQEVRIPLGAGGQTLQAFVYSPDDRQKHDVVIFNHGSVGNGNPHDEQPAMEQAAFFVKQGFIVLVPMRKGRGKSDGVSLESEQKNCEVTSWSDGIDSALEDLSAAVKYARGLPNFKQKIIMAGASRGGYLAVAYGARGQYKQDVAAVVNFVGSWVAQVEDQCPQDFNRVSFAQLGKLTNPPNLWLYASNDPYNDVASIRQFYGEFQNGQTDRRLIMYDSVPKNGHMLFIYPAIWEQDAAAFLEHFRQK